MSRKSAFNQGFDIDAAIANLPAGLDRAILRVLSFHVGRLKAIPRDELVQALASHGFTFKDDRPIRLALNQLRHEGHLICSTGGKHGGYFIASDWEELNAYLEAEVHSRAMDLLEQEAAMRKKGNETWGAAAGQPALF